MDDPDAGEIDKIIKEKMKKIQEAISEALSFTLGMPSFPQWEEFKKKKDQILKNLQDK